MSTRIEQLHMECIHLLLCLYILYWCTAVSGGFGASWLKVGWWGQLCIAITHMQPTACWCFSAQSHKKKRQNQCEIRTSTRANSRSSGCNSAEPIISSCKEEDCQVCAMRYFHYCRFQGVTTVIALDYTTCTVRPKCSSIGLCLGYVQCPMFTTIGARLTCFQGWASWSREIQKFCIWDRKSETTSHILLVHGMLIWHPPVRVF